MTTDLATANLDYLLTLSAADNLLPFCNVNLMT